MCDRQVFGGQRLALLVDDTAHLRSRGADLALLDLGSAGTVSHPPYRCATSDDLKETARLCEEQGVRVNAYKVDVRDFAGMAAAADDTTAQFGGINFVIANAGITDGFDPTWEIPLENWQTMIDINLTRRLPHGQGDGAACPRPGPGWLSGACQFKRGDAQSLRIPQPLRGCQDRREVPGDGTGKGTRP